MIRGTGMDLCTDVAVVSGRRPFFIHRRPFVQTLKTNPVLPRGNLRDSFDSVNYLDEGVANQGAYDKSRPSDPTRLIPKEPDVFHIRLLIADPPDAHLERQAAWSLPT